MGITTSAAWMRRRAGIADILLPPGFCRYLAGHEHPCRKSPLERRPRGDPKQDCLSTTAWAERDLQDSAATASLPIARRHRSCYCRHRTSRVPTRALGDGYTAHLFTSCATVLAALRCVAITGGMRTLLLFIGHNVSPCLPGRSSLERTTRSGTQAKCTWSTIRPDSRP